MFDVKSYQREYQKEWYKKNKAIQNARSKAHYEIKKETILKGQRDDYAKDVEASRERKREYYRKYASENRDKVRAAQKRYSDLNKEAIKLKTKERHQKNPDKKFEVYLKCKYGISIDDYNRMLGEQDSSCFICKTKLDTKNKKKTHIDHCHKSGQIRKILCNRCNNFLGYLENGYTELMEKINKYIDSSRD